MPHSHTIRDPYEEGRRAGAGQSLKLTIGAVKEYLEIGVLPRVGNDRGLRKELNDLLAQLVQVATNHSPEQEQCRANEDEVVVPLRRRRAH